jgi:Avidin family
MKRLVTALLIVVATSVSAFAQSFPVPSYWINQRGSEMKIFWISAQGIFRGVYINHASGFACQGTPYDLTGIVRGNHIAFTVVWNNFVQNCNSETFWHGHIEGKTIRTRWVLYTQGKVPVTLRGTDIFQLQP